MAPEAPVSGRAWCVVGGAGFIGSHLVARLLTEDRADRVVVLDNLTSGSRALLAESLEAAGLSADSVELIEGDCGDPEVAHSALHDIDVVVHLASNPDIARAVTEPEIDFASGTMLTNSVLEAARRTGVGTFVYASGSGVYGDLGDLVIPEDHGPLRPVSTYGASKLAGEALVCSYAHMFGMRGRAFRFANVVGPRQTHGVGYDFLAKLMADPSRLEILGDGRQSKCYIAVTDVLAGILNVLDTPDHAPYEVYNVSTDDGLAVDDIAVAACATLGLDPAEVTFAHTGGRGGWNGDVPMVRLDTGRIRALGWNPVRSSAEAMDWALSCMEPGADEPTARPGSDTQAPTPQSGYGEAAEGVEGTGMSVDPREADATGDDEPGTVESVDQPPPPPSANTDQLERMTQGEKRLLGGMAVAGVVVLLIVLALNLLGGDSHEESQPDPDPGPSAEQIEGATVAADGAEAAFTGDGALEEIPSEMSATGEPITDDLQRSTLEGGPLGWTVLGEGSWKIEGGALVTGNEPAEATPRAVVEVPEGMGSDWTFSTVSVAPADGGGFVFGVVDADNYWEIKFNRAFAAAELRHVQKGQPTTVKIIGPTTLSEGQTWTVQHVGDTVVLGAGGEPYLAVNDPSLEAPRKVGVIGSANDPATFADVRVAPVVGAG